MSSLTPIFSTPGTLRLRRGMLGLVIGCLTLAVSLPAASAQCGAANLTRSQVVPVLPEAALAPSAKASTSVATNKASNAPSQASIVGLWHVSFLSGGQVADVAFDAWHSDGTELLNDYTNPINGNVCMGAWAQADSVTYKLKHPSWYFDGSGNLLGTDIIHETVKVTPDGNHFTGTYLIDVYDLQGALQATFGGTLEASRITP